MLASGGAFQARLVVEKSGTDRGCRYLRSVFCDWTMVVKLCMLGQKSEWYHIAWDIYYRQFEGAVNKMTRSISGADEF